MAELSETEATQIREEISNQTAFTRDITRILIAEGGKLSGQEVKDRLETYYPEVNHGRLYPNLDRVVESGLAKKGTRDRRTNTYQVTQKGKRFIEAINQIGE